MRLIGNKTRLLPAIQDLLADRGFTGGTLIDIFSGTSSVGRHFKGQGFRVIANDHLSAAYTQAVAGVEVSRTPAFAAFRRAHRALIESRGFQEGLARQAELDLEGPGGRTAPRTVRDPSLPLRQAIHLLDRFTPPREGLVFRSFCPGGVGGRRYFRDDHGRKIDGCLELLRRSHREGLLPRRELHLLLAALIDAADRVANISGTYGAFLKSWQSNTAGEMRIEAPEVVESPHRNEAHREDSNRLIRRLSGDVLYVDPPYNHRQYAANYHVLDVIAEHHRVEDLASYEAALYGKTGLRPYGDLRSAYCVRPGLRTGGSPDEAPANVLTAFADLVLSARVRCVVVSYSEEGILSRQEIGAILARFARAQEFDFRKDLLEIDFPRFRSDSDRPAVEGRGGRSYRVLDGKGRDRLGELLFIAVRRGTPGSAVRGTRAGVDGLPRARAARTPPAEKN